MLTNEQQEKVNKAVDLMAKDPDILKIVREIEASPKTTKGHYGRYMHFIGNFASQPGMVRLVIAPALKKAGADPYGVDWAVKLTLNPIA